MTNNKYDHIDYEDIIENLMDTYSLSLINFAYTYVKDWGTAEDIIQEVFINVYHHLDSFEQRSSYKTWLYKITANKARDYLRKSFFKRNFITDSISFLLKPDISTPELDLINKSENRQIANMVLELPLIYREIIILYFYENMKLTEISSLLDINISTVKSRISRGKKLLKSKLERGSIYE